MASATDKKISYRGTPELRKKLKLRAADLDTSVQAVIDEALEVFFQGPKPEQIQLPARTGTNRRHPETEALLAWFQSPPTETDRILGEYLRARFKELGLLSSGSPKAVR